jgi:hypothetical protein
MLVRLTAKLADVVNGVDISCCREGDVVELPERAGRMLIAEHWAVAVPPAAAIRACHRDARAVAADRRRRHRR